MLHEIAVGRDWLEACVNGIGDVRKQFSRAAALVIASVLLAGCTTPTPSLDPDSAPADTTSEGEPTPSATAPPTQNSHQAVFEQEFMDSAGYTFRVEFAFSVATPPEVSIVTDAPGFQTITKRATAYSASVENTTPGRQYQVSAVLSYIQVTGAWPITSKVCEHSRRTSGPVLPGVGKVCFKRIFRFSESGVSNPWDGSIPPPNLRPSFSPSDLLVVFAVPDIDREQVVAELDTGPLFWGVWAASSFGNRNADETFETGCKIDQVNGVGFHEDTIYLIGTIDGTASDVPLACEA